MNAAAATLNPKNWCSNPFIGPREAILALDLAVQNDPEHAHGILYTAWTALTLLLNGKGMPDPRWLTDMGRFHKLAKSELERVRDAIDMRFRAIERGNA